MSGTERLAAIFAAIDAENAEDPKTIEVGGTTRPYAQVYGEWMSERLETLAPDASEHLRIAARAQHIRRFDMPRSTQPMDKPGYFAWRNALKVHHAEVVGRLMAEAGYDRADVDRVGQLVRKERIKRDPEAQTVEDCASLVFLEHEYAEFGDKYPDAKIVDIVAKTWVKMSEAGHAQALTLVPLLPERLQKLTVQAVTGA
ncbi:MAG: DUF4202 domain-containing protein [Phyllobacteriaceae bacterium]|nr:DUF4202 domain-containing protein [Phyllobacteriaceae bacterium]